MLILLVPIFRASVFSFFDIPILQGYYAFQCHALKGNIQEEKKFKDQISFYSDVIDRHYFIKVVSATNVIP